ncbi:head-tail joining protein [Chenggangzhangella methanolivorans]|uniref:Uncharacterized protein n=1 Tax=Chenggangzhangella methanolivorans TaxID=1437009 RepID=A0A9E6UHH6_9HYPH|nr:hypothetical protein [Chenggangzhangella methanolivorans]QZN99792.1 hypothetical protein K6K41_24535 [Chenggangzhangella methanolivorans]
MRQDLADLAVDAAFVLGAPASYRAPLTPGGAACKVMVFSPDADLDIGSSRVSVTTMRIDVRVSEIEKPLRDGSFDLLDATGAVTQSYRIIGDPKREDALRRIWTCVAEPV